MCELSWCATAGRFGSGTYRTKLRKYALEPLAVSVGRDHANAADCSGLLETGSIRRGHRLSTEIRLCHGLGRGYATVSDRKSAGIRKSDSWRPFVSTEVTFGGSTRPLGASQKGHTPASSQDGGNEGRRYRKNLRKLSNSLSRIRGDGTTGRRLRDRDRPGRPRDSESAHK